jgi:hypothetical protein
MESHKNPINLDLLDFLEEEEEKIILSKESEEIFSKQFVFLNGKNEHEDSKNSQPYGLPMHRLLLSMDFCHSTKLCSLRLPCGESERCSSIISGPDVLIDIHKIFNSVEDFSIVCHSLFYRVEYELKKNFSEKISRSDLMDVLPNILINFLLKLINMSDKPTLIKDKKFFNEAYQLLAQGISGILVEKKYIATSMAKGLIEKLPFEKSYYSLWKSDDTLFKKPMSPSENQRKKRKRNDESSRTMNSVLRLS